MNPLGPSLVSLGTSIQYGAPVDMWQLGSTIILAGNAVIRRDAQTKRRQSMNDIRIPDALAKHLNLQSAEYVGGSLSLTVKVSHPIDASVGADAALILQKVSAMDDDQTITGGEIKSLILAVGMIAARHYGVGKLLG